MNTKNDPKNKKADMKASAPGNKVDINKYQDLEGVSMNKLSFGLWWVRNKSKLKLSLIIILITASVVSWGYTIFQWSYYFAVLRSQDEEMVRIMAETTTVPVVYLKARSAKNVSISSVYMLEGGGKHDLYTLVQNPNERHLGRLPYCFIKGAENIDCSETFVLPGQTKYILSLAHEFSSRPKNVKLNINNITWTRIDPHEIPNWQAFQEDHLDFLIEDVSFTPASQNELTEKVNLNLLNFSITNNTPYSYYEMPLNIVLKRGNRVVAVNKYVIKDFGSNKKEDISLNWPGHIGSITEAEINADINILRQDIYSP
ncbi:hypothetical protein GF382_01635 [Candidatus Falkowbacteria bacterium]|nr:hypothetical protein [Candidatus Falkowbacteria bacterium]